MIQKGKVLGVAAKTYLPNYKEFYEQRWFTSALQLTTNNVRLCGQIVPIGANLLFETSDTTFGIEICEDLWSTIPPSSSLALQGAEILFNMSADNEALERTIIFVLSSANNLHVVLPDMYSRLVALENLLPM